MQLFYWMSIHANGILKFEFPLYFYICSRSNAYEDRESTYHESLHQGRVTCICTGRVGTKDILGTGTNNQQYKLN